MKLSSKAILFLALVMVFSGFRHAKAENFSNNQNNSSGVSNSEKIIGGYLPHYRMSQVNSEIFNYLTHVYYFAVGPSADGELGKPDTFQGFLTTDKISYISRDLDTLKTWRGSKPVKIFLVVGGWELSDFFDEAAADATTRANLVTNIKNFCLEHEIDGVDLDWEAYNGPVDDANYGLLVSELREAFKGTNLQISATVNPAHYSLAEELTEVDFLQIMSYGNYFEGDTQVSMSQLEEWSNGWKNNGWDNSKLVIGIPAFAKTPDDNSAMIYKELVDFMALDQQTDWVDHNGKNYYFNNINTVNQKTQFMMNNDLAGVMVWEIGQDVQAPGTKSLLVNIHETVKTISSSKNSIFKTNSIKVYPNPATNKISVEVESEEFSNIRVMITDVTGKVVLENRASKDAGIYQLSFDIGNLPRGYYILNCFDGKKSEQAAFIKN